MLRAAFRSIRPVCRQSLVQKTRQISLTPCIYGDPVKIKMPALSPTMTEGTITKWYKKEGDAIQAGDVLCDVETDKATVSFELEEEGVLAKILKPENTSNVQLGTVIALMVEDGEDWQNVSVPSGEDPAPEAASEDTTSAPASTAGQAMKAHISSGCGYGPAVRSLLELYRIEVSKVAGSGPHGRILKGDVLQYVKENNLKPMQPSKPAAPVAQPVTAPPSPQPIIQTTAALPKEDFVDIPLTNMRRTIAKRLTESKTTIPHAYASIDCSMEKLLQLRKDLIDSGTKVSVNDFIVKACAVALQRVPEVNTIWSGEEAKFMNEIDISVAVATENGLITPIIKNAIGISVQDISARTKELAGKARSGKLQPEEFMGGTFTISNLGMFGVTEFSAVINPPQACIMAVGSSRSVLDLQGQSTTAMTVTLSHDRRMVDEYLAARFLEEFKDAMESPRTLLRRRGRNHVEADQIIAK